MGDTFLTSHGSYRHLLVYKKAECIYDITYYFAHHFLDKGDRTVDQMVQAARSGKQNIAEGNAAAPTSRSTELKLTNVAKASMQELLIDYEDYLRVRGLERWPLDSPKAQQTREVCRQHSDPAYYTDRLPTRSDETIANIAILMINQLDYLLHKYIDTLQHRFLNEGGVNEQMYQARKKHREERGSK